METAAEQRTAGPGETGEAGGKEEEKKARKARKREIEAFFFLSSLV